MRNNVYFSELFKIFVWYKILKISFTSKLWLIGCLYYSPFSSDSTFIDNVEEICDTMLCSNITDIFVPYTNALTSRPRYIWEMHWCILSTEPLYLLLCKFFQCTLSDVSLSMEIVNLIHRRSQIKIWNIRIIWNKLTNNFEIRKSIRTDSWGAEFLSRLSRLTILSNIYFYKFSIYIRLYI